jgi:drug/metabolite transporter (DMT)-like permease
MTETVLPWRQWVPEFVLLALLWGTSFLFMREGAHAFGPFATAWVRISMAALMLTPVLVWRGEAGLLRQHWRPTFFVGMLNSGIPFVLYAYALLHISTGMSSILNATTPLFGAVIAWFWLGDKLNRLRSLGLALGFGGVVLLTIGVPGGISFTKRYLQGIPAMVTTSGSLWGVSVGLCIPALLTWPDVWPPLRAWAALAIAGLLCTALAYVLYFRLMTRMGPARAMTVTYLIPVFANLVGVVVLDEVVTPWMLGCGVVIVLGTALASGLVQRRA